MPDGPETAIAAHLLRQSYLCYDVVVAGPTKTGRWNESYPPGFKRFQKILTSSKYAPTLTSVNVKGRFMWWQFLVDNHNIFMTCTFGTSAKWEPIAGTDNKHTGFFFLFRNAAGVTKYLSFVDPRQSGMIKFVFSQQEIRKKLKTIGADALQEGLDAQKIFDLLNSKEEWKKIPICEHLVNQHIFAGIGNSIRAEALWRAKINPWKTPDQLNLVKLDVLCKEIQDVMKESFERKEVALHEPAESSNTFEFDIFKRSIDSLGNKVRKRHDSSGRNVYWAPARQQ